MNQEIHDWLNSQERNFNQGVSLMHKYGRNKILLKLFNRGPSKYNVEKLAWELKKLSGTSPAVAPVRIQQAPKPAYIMNPDQAVNIDPEVLKPAAFAMDAPTMAELEKIEKEWRALYVEAKNLHMEKLNDETPDKERATAVRRIAEIREDLLPNHYWPLVIQIKETGKLPEGYGQEKKKDDFDFGTTDPVKLRMKMQNLRTRVSKAKDDPAKAKQVETWQAQIAWIDEFLKNPRE